MYCLKCGEELAENAVFCHRCGVRVSGAQPATPVQPLVGGAAGGSAAPEEGLSRWQQAVQGAATQADEPEDELWQGRYSWKAMVGHGVLLGLGCLAAMVIAVVMGAGANVLASVFGVGLLAWIGLCLVLLYRQLSVRYQLTSHRFVHESGILRRVTDRVEVIDIDDINFAQGPIERLLGVGTIRLTSSDRTHPELQLRGIDGVQRVASMFDDSRRRERRKRGLHIEAV